MLIWVLGYFSTLQDGTEHQSSNAVLLVYETENGENH
jgi:hypothetical protein